MQTTETTPPEGPKTEPPPIEPILGAIAAEVAQQGRRWGFEHDRRHNLMEWTGILTGRAAKVFEAQRFREGGLDLYRHARHALVEVAAVAVSAIRAIDANKQAASPASAWCCSLCLAQRGGNGPRVPATHWSTDVDTGEPEPLCDGCQGAR
jgi:hypothetical protein